MPRYLDEIIKAENAMAVFKAVVDNKCETRADISGFTGLSVVTVNKAVEVFLNKGIFVQKDIESNAVGRHASHVFLDPTKILALVDISNRDFEFRCYDLGFNQVYSYRYRYMDDFTYKDNIRTFFYRVKAHMLDTLDSRYLMIGLIVPGTYDRDNDKMVNVDDYNKENINICKFIQSTAAIFINVTVSRMGAAVRHCQAICGPNENILYINIDVMCKKIQTRLIIGGKFLKKFGDAYKVLDNSNVETQIVDIISNACMLSNINCVYLDSDYVIFDKLIHNIKQRLDSGEATVINNVPEVIRCKINSFSHSGCLSSLRKIWLDRVVKF